MALKAVFFDARDTLGEVDRPGHLIPYRPSTQKLLEAAQALGLKLGVITNLPPDLTDQQGKEMISQAIVSEAADGRVVTLGDFIPVDNIVTNKAAGADKPDRRIYQFAAQKLQVAIDECVFVGENFIENLGARAAGMANELKPCPPGREFQPSLVSKLGASATDSGRQFEAMLEHEHLLGERIFACGEKISNRLNVITGGKSPALEARWASPPVTECPADLRRAMAHFMHLIRHFADQVHLKAEEAMLEVAIACGLDPAKAQWVLDQHDMARAYWAALDVAWRRIERGDDDDRFYAMLDFARVVSAFVDLFKAHALREDDETYPLAGSFFSDSDDALVLSLLQHSGPSDITPYVGMVERMEALLEVK